jgi:O-antigen ligase
MGILGSVPFLVLLLMLVRLLVRIYGWMRRTGNPYNPCIPFALVAIAGLVHACFEDWLFAVGSYLCLFFWVSAFLLIDLAPQAKGELRMPSPAPFSRFAPPQAVRQPTS